MSLTLLKRIARGRTDLVADLLNLGFPATTRDDAGTSLLQWCAYYGDVSAMRLLLTHGETLDALGHNFDLNGAAFHGHWRLCEFLLEQDADANVPLADTGETPLHAALCTATRMAHDLVLRVLLTHGASPHARTTPGVATGGFMRDCRTKGETPLHRAAAFGTAATVQLLLDAGADRRARDVHGDSPLSWASWYTRPDDILRLLCFDDHYVRPDRLSMAVYLLGEPED
ncbi:MAG: ankyrin repeat domain-containing protein [Gemmatimonadaceae bacterium]|nr:ankyrin repeat domain-containing protein [Gemmatimonadaceae bacterium]